MIYAIPFGMKAANDEILVQKSTSESNDSGIHQVINQNRVAHDLMKGEVTEQVSELRYRTYLIEHESKKYRYLGDGIAIKDENDKNWGLSDEIEKEFDFYQSNNEIIGSVEDELERIGKYGKREFTISLISKNHINKFNNTEYIILVHCSNKGDSLNITMSYSIYPNKYDPISRILINKLEDALNGDIKNNDAVCDFESLSFVTNKAIGEDDYKKYNFYNLNLCSIVKNLDKGLYEISYEASEYNVKYLLKEYYNKTMDEKYKSNEHRQKRDISVTNDELKYKCEDCGKMISEFDAEESKKAIGKIVCLDCLGKYAE